MSSQPPQEPGQPGQPQYPAQPGQPQYPGQPGQPQYPAQPGQQPYPQEGAQPQQYPPPGYQQQGYPPHQGYVAQRKTNGLAVASLVLGIVGLILFGFFMIPNILAVIFGFVALSQINRAPAGAMGGKGMAIAGLVMGLIGILFFILVVAFGTFSFNIGPTG
jgi:hypothetical protein